MGIIDAFLGAVEGGAAKWGQMDDERRKSLAEKLKAEALAKVQKNRDELHFGYEKEIIGEEHVYRTKELKAGQKFKAGQAGLIAGATKTRTDADRISKEKIASERNALSKLLAKAKTGTNAWKKLKRQDDALIAGLKHYNDTKKEFGTGDAAGANAIFEQGGVAKQFVEYEETPAVDNLIRKDIPAVMGYQLEDTAVGEASIKVKATGLKSELNDLLKKGENLQPTGANTKEVVTDTEGGIIGSQMGVGESDNTLPVQEGNTVVINGATGKMKKYNGWIFVIHPNGDIVGTPPGGVSGKTFVKPPSEMMQVPFAVESGPGGKVLSTRGERDPKYDEYMELLALVQENI